ncbi:G5 domain-containing protein [Candidatus Berkelbacteria bacterium]|nr:G5 domain-containing protein [Candidatus Berkelbacteria bacterium]
MRARTTVLLGVVAIASLTGAFVYLRGERSAIPSVQASASARQLASPSRDGSDLPDGLATQHVDGVDHLVERHFGAPGFFSIDEQLEALGVTLYPEDRYTAIPDPQLGVGSWIEIVRATPVAVTDAGNATTYRTWRSTVGQLIDEQGITLDSDDRIEPIVATGLQSDLAITITRVGVSEEVETEPIAYKKVVKKDDALEKGTSRVTQRGKDGLRKYTYRVTRENGVETKRELIASEISREPVEEITHEGTKVVSYGSGQATWYALRSGMQAAHNTLPFGTKVRVTNPANGKSVDVVITDRGIQGSAVIDLTADAFKLIAPLGAGRIQVRIEKDYD